MDSMNIILAFCNVYDKVDVTIKKTDNGVTFKFHDGKSQRMFSYEVTDEEKAKYDSMIDLVNELVMMAWETLKL